MDTEPAVRVRDETYQPDQLVVVLSHKRIVLDTLEKFGAKPQSVLESRDLGLALVSLSLLDIKQAVDNFKAKPWWPNAQARLNARGEGDYESIDELLSGLREYFKIRFGGWFAEIGKNRTLTQVYGKPEVQHHNDGWPEPVKPENGRLWEKRQAEPGLGVRVGVLDTALSPQAYLEGAYVRTPAAILEPLKDPFWKLWGRSKERWENGHATFVAGLILRKAPGAMLDVRAVLTGKDPSAPGKDPSATTWEFAEELAKMVRAGAHILNLSVGCYTLDNLPPLVMEKALAQLPPELVLVAAAGNQGQSNPDEEPGAPTPDAPLYPAALPRVIAVAAVDDNRKLARFSPRVLNPEPPGVLQPPPWVDVLAPGINLRSTYLAGGVEGLRKREPDGGLSGEFDERFWGFARWSGSSFSTAVVTGEIAAQTRPGQRGAAEVAAGLLASGERNANHLPFVSLPT
jgi:membrane-anchored mycosin MYCP